VKTLLLIPAVLLPIAALAWGVPMALGRGSHGRDVLIAAAVCLASGELALLPAVLLRSASPATLSQAALGGTVVHMFLSLIFTFGAWVAHVVLDKKTFLFLLLAFFWVVLVALVLAMVRLIRQAGQRHPQQPGIAAHPPR
jgi:hypothetical protein